MAWSGTILGHILVTHCSLAIDVKMNYMLRMLKKHDDLLNMQPSYANVAKILSVMAKGTYLH
jgi:hypothetical protein